MRLLVAAPKIAFMFLLLVGIAAQAADVKVLSCGGFREVMGDLGPKFERTTGHKLAITFGSAGAVAKRVQDGETADVVILARPGIDRLVKDGRAAAGDVTVVARASTGVAVRKGAHKPDISAPEALKSALLSEKSIIYSDPAGGSTSGIHFAKVLNRLGIDLAPKRQRVGRLGCKRRGGDCRGPVPAAYFGPWHRTDRSLTR